MINKNKFIAVTLLVIFCGAIISCSPQKRYRDDNRSISTEKFNSQILIKNLLYDQYTEWRGTPYKNGGMSKKGIDCSGLVFLTFKSKLGFKLPRTTEGQASIGNSISQENLSAGDLVFFKTGLWKRHVGIFIERGNFLHSSTSRGVIISNLQDYYWKDAYYLAKRIDFQ